MTKKKMTIIIVIIAVIAVVALSAAFLLRPKEKAKIELRNVTESGLLELVGLVEGQTEAEQLAEDYGISLLECNEGVATFRTDKTYDEIIKIGEEKGLTKLSINGRQKAF